MPVIYKGNVNLLIFWPLFKKLDTVLFVDKYSDITEELLLANDDLFQQAQTMDLSDLTLPKFFDNIVDRYVNT